jgi:hypothetical protein
MANNANDTISPETFLDQGRGIYLRGKDIHRIHDHHRDIARFRSIFGTVPFICSMLWEMVDPLVTIDPKTRPFHLLWALLLMFSYSTEVQNGSFVGTDDKTFRKWTHPWISKISDLSIDVIKWENRFLGNWYYWTFSLDGVHCPIEEPSPFWPGWYSYKYNDAGLMYELCVGVSTGYIIWIRGPFPAGKWVDLKVFDRELVANILVDQEKGVVDSGYNGRHRYLATAWWRRGNNHDQGRNARHERIRGRHEQVNGRLKAWNCLSNEFRHGPMNHQKFFYAVAVIVQLEIKHKISHQFEI